MKHTTTIFAVLISLLIFLNGCTSNSDATKEGESGADVEGGKLFLFYNQKTQAQYTYDSEHDKNSNLNSDASSNFYMLNKEAGELFFWSDEYEEGKIDEKVVMLKASYDFSRDGNITADDFFYLGHFHDDELAAHSADEFKEANVSDAKKAALVRLNLYLAEQEAIKEEITEALSAQGETLCNFLVPHHEEHEEHNTSMHEDEHEAPHYALSSSGKVFVFEEHNATLELKQSGLILDGVYECTEGESGMSATADGLFIFSKLTQTLYLVDAHGLDFHVHGSWKLNELLPSSVEATQMIGFGGSDEHEHEH